MDPTCLTESVSTEATLLTQFTALDTATVSDALDACGLPAGQNIRYPGGRQVRMHDTVPGAAGIGAQIRYVGAVHVVTAHDTWIYSERQALADLLEGGLDGERQVERRHALGVEPGAVDGGAVPRQRLERPFGIMRPIAGRLKPQAKPPIAM